MNKKSATNTELGKTFLLGVVSANAADFRTAMGVPVLDGGNNWTGTQDFTGSTRFEGKMVFRIGTDFTFDTGVDNLMLNALGITATSTPDGDSGGKYAKFKPYGQLATYWQLNFIYGVYSVALNTATLTANRQHVLPDRDGMVGVLPIYADSTAANAAVSVGDAWFDSTLKKVRVRLS